MAIDTAFHCVACGKEMCYGTDWDKFVHVCDNKVCILYGILQIGKEKMEALEALKLGGHNAN